MKPLLPLHATLQRLEAIIEEQGLSRSRVLNPKELSTRTALPEPTVRALLRGKLPPSDTVNERVRARIKYLADAYLARSGKPMAELAGSIHRELGVSPFWARQVCSGEKMPSVELLHGLVGYFAVPEGEAFFTAPAPEALNRALQPVLTCLEREHQQTEREASDEPPAHSWQQHEDVRSIALRQAQHLPQEQWNVLNATLKALLEIDDKEDEEED